MYVLFWLLFFSSLVTLLIGMATPTIFKKKNGQITSRREIAKGCGIFIIMFFFLGVATWPKSQDNTVQNSGEQALTKKEVITHGTSNVSPTTLPISLTDRIKEILNDSRDNITVTSSSNDITVSVDTKDPVSKFGTGVLFYVGDANIDAAAVFRSVFPLDPKISSVTTNLYVQVTDIYGKQAFKNLVSITILRVTYNKIVWDNFDARNLPKIADNYSYDTSIKDSDIYPLGTQ
jgi:hypothetical protein